MTKYFFLLFIFIFFTLGISNCSVEKSKKIDEVTFNKILSEFSETRLSLYLYSVDVPNNEVLLYQITDMHRINYSAYKEYFKKKHLKIFKKMF